jgi:hypothetical protein
LGSTGGSSDVTTAMAAWKVCIVRWNLCTKSAFTVEPRNTEAKIDRLDYSFVYGERHFFFLQSIQSFSLVIKRYPVLMCYKEPTSVMWIRKTN